MLLPAAFLLFLLVGVSRPRHISYYDNKPADGPIVSATQERRICAELCMSGLGGEPCGSTCYDVLPQGLPRGSQQSAARRRNDTYTRRDACPLLCANHLGFPLCDCDTATWTQPFFRADFVQVCRHFCSSYSYQIYGCDACDVYKALPASGMVSTAMRAEALQKAPYDWNNWCVNMCKEGDGGSACYCDILPMSVAV